MARVLFAFLVVAVAGAVVSSFQPPYVPQRARYVSTTAVHGIFDGFVKGMEANYDGEDSAFKKQKVVDEKKRLEKKKKMTDRKKRGYTDLKDVKQRTFAKLKYGDSDDEEPPPPKEKKKLFGMF